MNRVLQPLLGARVIPPAAVAEGNRNVGLLDVAQHLVVELFLQAGQWSHHCFGIGVFGFEVGGDFGIFLVAQPGVVVDKRVAVKLVSVCCLAWQRGNARSVISFSV